jgi:hypothetical protein
MESQPNAKVDITLQTSVALETGNQQRAEGLGRDI